LFANANQPVYPAYCPYQPGRPIGPYPVGMAYVPWQGMGELYDPCTALGRGTIFPELDLSFWKAR
jgi:hypothetical protein